MIQSASHKKFSDPPGAFELPGVAVALHVLVERRPRVEALAAGRALKAPVAGVVGEVLSEQQGKSLSSQSQI